jgi:hypothetical protein
MPKCQPCLSDEIKEIIRDNTHDTDINKLLDTVPTCPVGTIMELCLKKKRTTSAYQQFVSECMKKKNIKGFGNAPIAMKECALEWKNR